MYEEQDKTFRKSTYDDLLKIAKQHNYSYVSEAFADLHMNKFYSPTDLSEMFGIAQQAIYKRLNNMNCYVKLDIGFKREKLEIALSLGYKTIHECIVSEYEKSKSIAETSKIMKSSTGMIANYLKKHNVKTNKKGGANNQRITPEQIKLINSIPLDSAKKLSERFNCSTATILRYRRQYKEE